MATTTARIQGLNEMNEILDQLPARIARQQLQKAVNKGAGVVLKATVAAAPSGWAGGSLKQQSAASKKYGALKSNLRVRTMTRIRKSGRGAMVWTRDAFWAVFYEFGTAHQPARPFMRPAFDASSAEAVNTMVETLATGLESEAKKLAGEYRVAKKSLGVK
jgi:HK97 gp10 family phage protein